MTPKQAADFFQNQILNYIQDLLLDLSETTYSQPIAPGKWSPKQIIGHLIDSANNNHARFIKAQMKEDLIFEGYAQVEWVDLQHYHQRDWSTLVSFWHHYNLHICHIIDNISEEAWRKKRAQHSLDKMAWQTRPTNEPVTLGYFVLDYIGHLEHHVRQIIPDYVPKLIQNPL
ncbi:hypothetical protein BKI52_10730 [marine bacterium AO1-C]|nr:hypothetical protein BKI52_10730 [marine bacterium AO1-C]